MVLGNSFSCRVLRHCIFALAEQEGACERTLGGDDGVESAILEDCGFGIDAIKSLQFRVGFRVVPRCFVRQGLLKLLGPVRLQYWGGCILVPAAHVDPT